MVARKRRFDLRELGRQALTVYLVLLVANVLVFALVLRPRAHRLEEFRKDSGPRLERLRAREAEVRAAEGALSAYDLAKSELAKLREEVLATRNRRMIDVQLELASLAREFSINLQQVQYENDKLPDEGLERMAMVVPLEGGYSNLRKFVQAVESSTKFLVVERVALASGPQGGVMLQLNITLATYFDDPEAREARARESRRSSRT